MPDQIVACSATRHFQLSGASQRDREKQPLVPNIAGHVDWCRQRIVLGHPKRRAVREHTGNAAQSDFPDAQKIALEFDIGEAPAVGNQRLTARLDVALEVPVLLLKMLRLKKKPFG